MRIIASGLSRTLQHLKEREFGVVSAYLNSHQPSVIKRLDKVLASKINDLANRYGKGTEDYFSQLNEAYNKKLQSELKRDARKVGLGFVELISKWEENGVITNEESILIPKANRDLLIKLGAKYDQYSILYGDKGRTEHICTVAEKCGTVGKTLEVFEKGVLSQKDLEGAFSLLKKGSKGAKNTRFKLLELKEAGRTHF